MLKLSILSILFTSILSLNGLKTMDSPEIPWDNSRKLCWEDFQGLPGSKKEIGAATHVYIKVLPKVRSGSRRVGVQVKALFACDKSWAKSAAKGNQHLLNHEQRHFDIAELYARKIRRDLQSRYITTKNYNQIKAEVIEKLFEEYTKEDERYDLLTVHGLDTLEQEKWNLEIDEALEALDTFR